MCKNGWLCLGIILLVGGMTPGCQKAQSVATPAEMQEAFEFLPGTVGPGRFCLFGHVETVEADGCLHFRNFKIGG